jgi:hypothetical protein
MYQNLGGKFTSPDEGPLVAHLPRTLNRYAFVQSDPINFTDPDGNFTREPSPEPMPIPGHCPAQFSSCYQFLGSAIFAQIGALPTLWDKNRDSRRRAVTSKLQSEVAANKNGFSDCQAMAKFSIWAASAADNLYDFADLMSNIAWSPLKTGAAGSTPTDWNADFEDTIHPTQDQSHHFAIYFYIGFRAGRGDPFDEVASRFGSVAGELAQAIWRGDPVDWGDIRLGDAAVRLGADVANGKVQTYEVAGKIKNDFCK